MARSIVKESEKAIMYLHQGLSKFSGCQCFKDCSCHEDFKPEYYSYYTVVRKCKKTTRHESRQDAEERWNFIESLARTA